MPELNRCPNCGTPLPASTQAGECTECRLQAGLHDSGDGRSDHTRFPISRLNLLAVLLWLLGVALTYICSWPAYESMIPEDRKVVSISEDGRFLATVRSPAKLVKMFSGRVEYQGDQAPRGPIEIWDARGGTVIRSIDCGTDLVNTVHFMDRGNLVFAAFRGQSRSDTYVSTWRKGTTQPMKKLVPGMLMCCADVDGTTIAVVMEDLSVAKVIDLRSGEKLSQFASIPPWKIVLSPDGSRVFTVDSRTEDGYKFRVLDTITGTQFASFLEPDYPKAWSLSPDGKTLWIVVTNKAKNEASLHGWDIESQRRHTSITPSDRSPTQAMLMSAIDLKSLTPSFLQVTASGHYPALIRLNEKSIDVVDAHADGDLFTDDGSLQVAMEYDSASESSLIVRRMEDRSEIFRLPARGVLEGLSPDLHYLAMQKFPADGLAALRQWLSSLLHTPPEPTSHPARDIYAVDLRDGTSHLVGVLPQHRFKFFASDGFIDGGKRILVNNTIWEFPGHRPWAMILLLPLLVVAVFYWAVNRWCRRKLLRRAK